MPNGPGIFHPAESTYARPGTYEAGLAAEATKQARYLSEMDKFYAQLAEMQTQFEKTHELALGRFEWEKEYGAKGLELKKEELELRGEQIEGQQEYWSGMLEETKKTRIGGESPFLSPYQDPRYGGEEKAKDWTPGETLEFMKGAWDVTEGTSPRRGTFPGAGTAIYGPEGLMVAGGSEASYDPLERMKFE